MKSCYDQLIVDYSIDEKCIIIGGFSGGANAAIDIVMANAIPERGFIALYLGDNVMTFKKNAAKKSSERGVKGIVLDGEDETEVPVQDMLKTFKEVSLPCEYYLKLAIFFSLLILLFEKYLLVDYSILS